MKIAYETVLKSSMESLWEIVGDFSKYPEWNPVITSIEGETTPESILKITLKLSGSLPRHTQAIVTGFAKPKYFSFEIQHRFGAWFYHEEWIFRMKERADATNLIAEAYVTGLGLRFRRSKIEDAFRRSLFNVVDAIKERVGNSQRYSGFPERSAT